MNNANLLQLASFLDNVPSHTFDMSMFMQDIRGEGLSIYQHTCGTVACAIGYGPEAGLEIADCDHSWFEYGERVTEIRESSPAWDWCFGAMWNTVDNTPEGAAKRIRYLVDHGSPPEGYSRYLEDEFVSAYQ